MPHSHQGSRKMVALGVRDEGVRAALAFALEASGYATCICPLNPSERHHLPLAREAVCLVLDCEGRDFDFPHALARWWGIDLDRPIVVLASAPGLALLRTCVEVGAQVVEKPLLGNALLSAIDNLPAMKAIN